MLGKKIAFSQALLLSTAFVLTACGGGGSSSDITSTPSAGATTTTSTTVTPATPAVQAASECPFGNYQAAIVSAINTFRATGAVCGGIAYPAVGALGWNGQLESAAAVHSTDMVVNNFFAHQSPTTGKTFRERLVDAGYNWTSGGENIAAGQASVSQVMADWIASPSHCSNMMISAYRDVGVSCKSNSASTYQYYWTLEMGVR